MHSYTFHINLYDLAFLGAIFIGLAFAVLLYFAKAVNRSANRFLALALVTMILWMIRILVMDLRLETYLPGWDLLPMQFLLALGPLMYFYVLKITRPQYKLEWKDLVHFSPLLIEQAIFGLEIRESATSNMATYATQTFQQLNPVLQLIIFISVITYLYQSYKLIERFYTRLQPVMMDRSRLEFRWLRRLLGATALLWCLWIVCAIVHYFAYRNQTGIEGYYPFYIFFVVIIIWTATAAFLKPQAAMTAQAPSIYKPQVPAELRAKATWVKKAMEANRYFEDPELSLRLLAAKVNLHPHELSRVINTALKKNFNDFINEFRVRDVVEKMQDPAYDNMTLLGIAYEAGFNSQTSFNRIFKQLAGKSPLEYKNDLKKEQPTYHLGNRAPFAALISNHQTTHKRVELKLNRSFMFRNALKITWRNFLRDRQFTFLNLIGLSTGLACTLLIYLWISDETAMDKFHQNDKQLYQVMVNQGNSDGIQTIAATNALLARTLKTEMPEVEYAAGALPPGWGGKVTLSNTDININAQGQYVDKDYLDVFTYPLIEGNKDQALADKNSIVISREMAMRLFHTVENLVGKTITLQHEQPYLISGIFENVPNSSSRKFDFLLSLDKFIDQRPYERDWGKSSDPNTFLVLKKGTDITAFNHKIAGFMKTKVQRSAETLFVRQYSSGYLYGTYENGQQAGGRITYVRLFAIIAIFILVIACINFMNLSTAKATKRIKEVGVKKAVGATRQSLILQYLGESLLMTLISVAIAVAMVLLFLPQFNSLTGKQLSLAINGNLVLVVISITLVTGFLAGSYPALYLSSFNPAVVLKGKIKTAVAEVVIRKGLVVFQFTISVIFIIAVIVVYQQIQYIQTKSQGYNKENVLTFDLSGVSDASGKAFLEEAKNLPGIINASGMDHGSLINDFGGSDPSWDGKAPGTHIAFSNIGINYGMFETLGLELAAGRSFSKTQSADTLEAIVNQAAVEAMGIRNPIGKHINVFGDGNRIIVGVVKDFHFQSMHDAVRPFVLRLVPDASDASEIMVRIKTGNEKQAIAQLDKLYRKYHPGYPFEYRFLDDDYQQQYGAEKLVGSLSRYFGGLAILISCLGLFGLAAFTAERRIKEIGVRKVLGASVNSILILLSRDLLKLVGIAMLIAFPIAIFFMNQWLHSFAYRTTIGLNVFFVTAVLIIIITLATISYQSIKAALANPVKSLRSE